MTLVELNKNVFVDTDDIIRYPVDSDKGYKIRIFIRDNGDKVVYGFNREF